MACNRQKLSFSVQGWQECTHPLLGRRTFAQGTPLPVDGDETFWSHTPVTAHPPKQSRVCDVSWPSSPPCCPSFLAASTCHSLCPSPACRTWMWTLFTSSDFNEYGALASYREWEDDTMPTTLPAEAHLPPVSSLLCNGHQEWMSPDPGYNLNVTLDSDSLSQVSQLSPVHNHFILMPAFKPVICPPWVHFPGESEPSCSRDPTGSPRQWHTHDLAPAQCYSIQIPQIGTLGQRPHPTV